MAKKKKRLKKYAFGDWLEASPEATMGTDNYNSNNIANPSMNGFNSTYGDYGRSDSVQGTSDALGSIPVVGSINSGIRSNIGDPLMDSALEIDSKTGGYKNIEQARGASVSENFFDPLTGIQNTFNDENASVGDKLGSIFLGGVGAAESTSDRIDAEDAQMRREFSREKQRRGDVYGRQQQQADFANNNTQSDYFGLSNFAFGGPLNSQGAQNGFRKYDGKSHEDSRYEGIPVDKNGEPSVMSGGQPVGLTEGNEVKYTFKDKNTYIFSDKF